MYWQAVSRNSWNSGRAHLGHSSCAVMLTRGMSTELQLSLPLEAVASKAAPSPQLLVSEVSKSDLARVIPGPARRNSSDSVKGRPFCLDKRPLRLREPLRQSEILSTAI